MKKKTNKNKNTQHDDLLKVHLPSASKRQETQNTQNLHLLALQQDYSLHL